MKLRLPLILSKHRAKPRCASKDDWVIDLGPEGGDKGGEIVAEDTPEQVAREKRSYTGAYLKPLLEGHAPETADAPKSKARRSAAVREREAAE